MNKNILSGWIEYAIFTTFFNLFYYLFASSRQVGMDFMKKLFFNLIILIIPFSLNEKIRKESFVLNLTNSKTKKQLMRIFNQIQPSCIISKDGGIQICNEGFENLFEKSFKIKCAPGNLLRFIGNDTLARDKLTKTI